ncbi:MAG: protoheme IX farnesyltransferase [Pseudomonadota bacterium]
MTHDAPHDAPPKSTAHVLTEEERKRRDRRNLAIAGLIVGFIVLVYLVTMMRLAANVSAGAS